MTDLYCQHDRLNGCCEDCNLAAAIERGYVPPEPVPHNPYQPVIAERTIRVPDDESDIDRATHIAAGTTIPAHLVEAAAKVGKRHASARARGGVKS